MIRKFTLFIIVVLASVCASAQVKKTDSIFARYDTLSTIPDTLFNRVDTSKKTLLGQTTTNDTVITQTNNIRIEPDKKPQPVKLDRRWFISPFLKFQAQEFGMLEQQRRKYESDAYLLPFQSKSMLSLSASIYKNFTKNISMSADLGGGTGHVTSKDALISSTKSQTSGIGNLTLYYHLLDGRSRLQPFLSGGMNAAFGNAAYLSAPVGAGAKFTAKKIMIEAQGAYGYSLSSNMANSLMYHMGVYIPFRTKKQKGENGLSTGKDTTKMNITYITNNYYLINKQDSIRKVQEDSMKRREDEATRLQIIEDSVAFENLSPDDPMRLPKAKKYIVYFYYDQYSLTTNAFSTINEVIAKMKADKNLHVHLKGHTDQSGSEQYNSPLSKKRAQMVFDYINSMGVPAENILLTSYGKLKPAVKNEDPNTAWMNRRCEIVLFEQKD
jgi:outer membrane protein OmpA-like peptidoglycan-associated protein